MIRELFYFLAIPLCLTPLKVLAETSEPSHENSGVVLTRPINSSPLSGISFTCTQEEITKIKLDFEKLFGSYGWLEPKIQVKTHLSAEGTQLRLVLNTPSTDTDTLTLNQRAELKLVDDIDKVKDKDGNLKDYKHAGEKEILAAMLQHGRLFEFDHGYCSFDKVMEQVKIRKNIIHWGIRAMWEFPDSGTSLINREKWNIDGNLQKGVSSSEAVADAFIGNFKYEIGCTRACQQIMAQGILDYFKNVKKDSVMTAYLDSVTHPHPYATMAMKGPSKKLMTREGTLVDRHFDVPGNNWVPGDWGWIKNSDNDSAEENGLEGCNIVYIGSGLFVVYYGDAKDRTLDECLVRVYQWRHSSKQQPETQKLKDLLRRDPYDIDPGLLRNVRDFPKNFKSLPIDKQPTTKIMNLFPYISD